MRKSCNTLVSCYLASSESDSNTNRKSDDSTSIEGYIDSDSSTDYLLPAAKQRKRRYHDFTGHPTVSTELEEMEDFLCSPNSIPREGPAVSQETWRKMSLHLLLLLTYVQDKRKVEPTIKLVEDRETVNDFLTWIQKDRPCAPTRTTYAVDCSLLAAAPVAGVIPAKDGGA